ncbi:MAG: diguanylate cyclase domain-containing protein [Hungatella hathewayi]
MGNDETAENQKELHLTMEQNQIIMDQTTDMILEWDIVEDTITCSENWLKKFGYTPVYQGFEHLAANADMYHIHPHDIPKLVKAMRAIRDGKGTILAEARVQNSMGQYIWCRFQAMSQGDEQGRPVKAVGIITDIDDEKKMLEELRRRAERDSLTGLYNRVETERQICRYLEKQPNELCALFIIDTDNFNQVNDSQGHLFGDAVLSELAAGMKRMIRESDVVGRIGGDEFTIFLKNISSREMVIEKAQSLINMFRGLFRDDRQMFEISCSVGIAVYPDDGDDFHSLYHNADMALYQAKKQGKNQYVMMNSEDDKSIGQYGASTLGAAIDSDLNTRELPEDLVNYVFQILYNTKDIDHAIQLILEIVGKRFDVSRSYIFENSEDGRYTNNTFEWCNDGMVPVKEDLQNLPYDTLGEYREWFLENPVIYCRDINSLPPKMSEVLKPQGIYSILQCAIMDNDKFYGFVGFDECTGLRMWTKEEVAALTLISQLINTFLLKKRASEKDRQLSIQLNTILDNQDAYVYVIEKSNYQLVYLNRKTRELDPSAHEGMTCYQAFFGREQPCENCLLAKGSGEIYNYKYDVWTKVRVAPLKWGATDAYLLSCFDITEYKQITHE